MKTTTILKYLSVASGAFGCIASQSAIPGVSEKTSVTIIGVSALAFKVLDIVENALKAAPPQPSKPTT